MCLIIHKPAGTEVPADLVRNAWEDNPDGAGLMYQEGGEVKVYKVMPGNWADPAAHISKVLSDLTNREVGIHFRWKTHGPISEEMAHPYKVADGAAWLMHNGVLATGKDYDGSISDTLYYVRKTLDKIPGPDDAEFWRFVEQDIQASKFLLLFNDGKFLRLNDKLWNRYKGLVLSNTHCVPELSNYKRRSWSTYDDDGSWYETGRSRSRPVAGLLVDYSDKTPTAANDPAAGMTRELPARLTRRERKIMRDCLRLGHWGPFNRLGGK